MPWLSFGLREGFRAKTAHALHISSNRSILTAPVGQVGRGSDAGRAMDIKESGLSGFLSHAAQVAWVSHVSRKDRYLALLRFFFRLALPSCVRVLTLTLIWLHLTPRRRARDTLFCVFKLTGGAAAYTKKTSETRVRSRFGSTASWQAARHRRNQQERSN